MEEQADKKEKNKGGRPPKTSGRKGKTVSIAVSEEDYAAIKLKAAAVQMSVSSYCHQLVMSGKVVDVYSDVTAHDRQVLAGLANNINQLAYKANVGKFEGIEPKLSEALPHIFKILDKYYDSTRSE